VDLTSLAVRAAWPNGNHDCEAFPFPFGESNGFPEGGPEPNPAVEGDGLEIVRLEVLPFSIGYEEDEARG